ncbi:MAG: tetratricopeptide repeat protein [Paracoccaceae bacterium]
MSDAVETDRNAATNEEIRDALDRVLNSDLFSQTLRLKNFLTYIIEETLAGRSGLIRGKTIAIDVYQRDPSDSDYSENFVRVDARRLRRRLVEYYATEGKNDPAIISVDKGGYAPRIEVRATPEVIELPVKFSKTVIIAGAAILVAGLAGAVFYGSQTAEPAPVLNDQNVLERQALREKSVTTLKAANLAEQARGFLFPLLEPERQQIATDLFRQAIKSDPDYFGGYAGAAQSLTTLSKLKPAGPEREETLAEASLMAGLATEKNATAPWTQSAVAWVAFGNREFDRAFEFSNRAVKLSPDDGFILDFHALISVLSGHFEEALAVSDPSRPRKFDKRRLANRNIFAVANFHLGNHAAAIASFREAEERGDPFSALSLMYQSAAYQALGDTEKASGLVHEMQEAWPNFRPERLMPNIYQHQEHTDQILDRLRAAGWRPSE